MEPTAIQHIVSTPGTCGGKPRVDGTRIRVWDIHVWHDLEGRSPAEIAAEFSQLSLADIYAALAYYHDHRDAIEAQMKQAEEFVARMEAQQGATRFTLLRDGGAADDDPVSP
ncbi:MAG: DUF433 domain-containing protein [Pirellulales bacterium]|jgi:uncharacterized protein (DUF433 family)